MSDARWAIGIFRTLELEDFKILEAVEKGMKAYRYVPYDSIIEFSNLSRKEVDFRLGNLSKARLVRRRVKNYTGYAINWAGYDCLALNVLVKKNVLEAIGLPIGVGKESEVYEGLTPKDERVAIKFHRLGRTSFRKVRRLRGYIEDVRDTTWLSLARVAAEREFQALEITYPLGVSVPKPISRNRHIIVMSVIEGTELENLMDLPDQKSTFIEIIENVKKTYLNAKIIHCDLSGFNVLIRPDERILIIDWAQYVNLNHPNAEDLLKRDIKNMVNLFKRKFNHKYDLEKTLSYIKGEIDHFYT